MTTLLDQLDVYFDLFGVEAICDGNTFYCIFDNNFVLALDGVETSTPAAHVKDSDVTALSIAHGTEITINNALFKVTGIQLDGSGVTLLILENIDE
jgi:hypothetical protein